MLDVVKVAALQSPMCGDVCLLGCFTGHLKGGDGVYGYFFGLTMIPTFAQRFFWYFYSFGILFVLTSLDSWVSRRPLCVFVGVGDWLVGGGRGMTLCLVSVINKEISRAKTWKLRVEQVELW